MRSTDPTFWLESAFELVQWRLCLRGTLKLSTTTMMRVEAEMIQQKNKKKERMIAWWRLVLLWRYQSMVHVRQWWRESRQSQVKEIQNAPVKLEKQAKHEPSVFEKLAVQHQLRWLLFSELIFAKESCSQVKLRATTLSLHQQQRRLWYDNSQTDLPLHKVSNVAHRVEILKYHVVK
jgi:hypothetical protein